PLVNVGNHWLSQHGELLVLDDARAPLPAAMKPQEEAEIRLTVTAPKRPGPHWLEFDVVQEFVLWFQTMGSQTTRIPCHVQAKERPLAAAGRGFQNRIRATRGYRLGARIGRRLLRSVPSFAWTKSLAKRRRASGGDAVVGFEPIMETYGIAKDELVKWI